LLLTERTQKSNRIFWSEKRR